MPSTQIQAAAKVTITVQPPLVAPQRYSLGLLLLLPLHLCQHVEQSLQHHPSTGPGAGLARPAVLCQPDVVGGQALLRSRRPGACAGQAAHKPCQAQKWELKVTAALLHYTYLLACLLCTLHTLTPKRCKGDAPGHRSCVATLWIISPPLALTLKIDP